MKPLKIPKPTTSKPNWTFGMRLYNARRNKGLTQEELARKARCNVHTVNRYERDLINPSLFIVADLAKILEVSIDYLVYGKE